MKTIVPTLTIALILALPGPATAQPVTRGGAPIADGSQTAPPRGIAAPSARDGLMVQEVPATAIRPPRSETAIGPDLMAYIFAPIGVVVAPITEGVHAVDTLIAPISDVLQPIVGPLNPPPLPPEATLPPGPAGIGPRK